MRLLIAPGLKPEPLLLTPDGEPIPTAPGAANITEVAEGASARGVAMLAAGESSTRLKFA